MNLWQLLLRFSPRSTKQTISNVHKHTYVLKGMPFSMDHQFSFLCPPTMNEKKTKTTAATTIWKIIHNKNKGWNIYGHPEAVAETVKNRFSKCWRLAKTFIDGDSGEIWRSIKFGLMSRALYALYPLTSTQANTLFPTDRFNFIYFFQSERTEI